MNNIYSLVASAADCNPETWDLSQKSEVDRPSTLLVRVGEEIDLPVYQNFNINNDL